MRAALITRFGWGPSIEQVPVPVAGPGELLIRVKAAVVSHLDATVATGTFPVRPNLPYIPGVEGAGTVVDTSGVDGFHQDQKVRLYGAGLGLRRPGTLAEFVSVPASAVLPVPDGVDAAAAAAVGAPALTALAALDIAGLEAGARLGVTGATGAVGSLAVLFAAKRGIATVAMVRDAGRAREWLPSGIECVALDEVGNSPPGAPLDAIIDTVGGPEMTGRAGWIRPGGRLVLVGYTAGTEVKLDLPSFLAADVTLLPVNMMRRSAGAKERLVGVLDQMRDGSLSVSTELLAQSELGGVFDRLSRGGNRGRLVVTF